MKTKIFKLMAMLLCAAMVCGLTSCNREEDGGNGDGDGVSCGETHGEWVDLGLPSGLLWYSVNIGASSPEQYGCYFAWGETQAKEEYSKSTYRYSTANAIGIQKLTKYNTKETHGSVDNKTVLEASDDVATAVLGTGARIPTKDEWRELLDNTTEEWTTQNGEDVLKFTASNGNTLFLPAAGYRGDSYLYDAGDVGRYLSSSLYTDDPNQAWFFQFYADHKNTDATYRYYGQSVRAVRASQN